MLVDPAAVPTVLPCRTCIISAMSDTNLCDILFPQNLPPLTYSVPARLASSIEAGVMVLAPLRGKTRKGIVLRRYPRRRGTFKGRLNEVTDAVMPAFSTALVELVDWTADYYITNHGTVLKDLPFKEMLKTARRPRRREPSPPPPPPLSDKDICAAADAILTEVRRKSYRTFLYHARGQAHETALVLRLAEAAGRVLIVTPEVREAEALYSLLNGLPLGGRVCIYHGEMKRSERYDSIEGIYSGRYDIVVGTRPAVFAPLFSPALVIVTREHDPAYKQEEAPRYHGRDVAVMRGFIEKIPVVLTSATPSVESFHNAFNNRYTLLGHAGKERGPSVSIVDLKGERLVAPFLTSRLLRAVRSAVNASTPPSGALVVIQRRGYAMLRCDDCEEMETCPECQTPLVLHRDRGLLCHVCGHRKEVPLSCGKCGGVNLSHLGAGTERIAEELERHTGIDILRIDSDVTTGTDDDGKAVSENTCQGPGDRYLVVGTFKAGNIPRKGLALVALLNPDIMLNLPEVKAPERLVQEVFSLKELLSNEGTLLLQTSIPWHPLYQRVKKWDYAGFVKDELRVRKESNMPPYTKLITVNIYVRAKETDRSAPSSESLGKEVRSVCGKTEVLGPFRIPPKLKGYGYCFQFLLRDGNRQVLKECARSLKSLFEKRKLTLRIDVDPVLF